MMLRDFRTPFSHLHPLPRFLRPQVTPLHLLSRVSPMTLAQVTMTNSKLLLLLLV